MSIIELHPDAKLNRHLGNFNYQVTGHVDKEPFIVNITVMFSGHAVIQVFVGEGLPSTEAISRLALRHVGLDPDLYQWTDTHRKRVWDLTFLGE